MPKKNANFSPTLCVIACNCALSDWSFQLLLHLISSSSSALFLPFLCIGIFMNYLLHIHVYFYSQLFNVIIAIYRQ